MSVSRFLIIVMSKTPSLPDPHPAPSTGRFPSRKRPACVSRASANERRSAATVDAVRRLVHRFADRGAERVGGNGDAGADDRQDERIFGGRSAAVVQQKVLDHGHVTSPIPRRISPAPTIPRAVWDRECPARLRARPTSRPWNAS